MTETESSYDYEVSRRKFLSGLIGAVAGAVAAAVAVPAIAYVTSPGVKQQNSAQWMTLGPMSSLVQGQPTGYPYSRTVKDGWTESTQSGVAYAITFNGQTVTVFSNLCTHLSCRVTWHPDQYQYICPCHDGRFAVNGVVLSGPPPRPLYEFPSRIENGQIQILVEA
jgi:menaquinol-cytochrome c reductase iron-sulfur subunit